MSASQRILTTQNLDTAAMTKMSRSVSAQHTRSNASGTLTVRRFRWTSQPGDTALFIE